jgi:hypothetical protein
MKVSIFDAFFKDFNGYDMYSNWDNDKDENIIFE